MCVCVLPECLYMYMHEHDLHVPLCLSTGVFYRSVEPLNLFICFRKWYLRRPVPAFRVGFWFGVWCKKEMSIVFA